MPKLAPLCRYCGGAIKKRTRTVYLRARPLQPHEVSQGDCPAIARYLQVDKLPTSINQCRTMTNHQVVSVKYRTENTDGEIGFFSEWDGTSYVDEFFCNGGHAKSFAYVMVKAGKSTVAYNDARAAQREKPAA